MLTATLVIFFLDFLPQVKAIACFSCYGIKHPKYCGRVEYCKEGEICLVNRFRQQHTGIYLYYIGCIPHGQCEQKNNLQNDTCMECCSADLCNNEGCGEPDNRIKNGTICYNCRDAFSEECHQVTTCNDQQMCSITERHLLGESYFSTGCKTKTECNVLSENIPVIGRRKRSTITSTCCSKPLCNRHSTLKDKCISMEKCKNGGVCLRNGTKPKCDCLQGYSGNLCEYKDNKGKEFIFGFMDNLSEKGQAEIYLASSSQSGYCNIIVSFLSINQTIHLKRYRKFILDIKKDIFMNSAEVGKKAIYIKCDMYVAVFGMNNILHSPGGFMVLPTAALGTQYIIASFTINENYRNEPDRGSSFGVIALHNNTVLNIKLRMAGGTLTFHRQSYKSNEIIVVQLAAFETFYIRHAYDLSGTLIKSSNPVAVVSGTKCDSFDNTWCDHITEMLSPTNGFSKSFILPNLHSTRNKFRIFALKGTTVSITNATGSYTSYLSENDFGEFNHEFTTVVQANQDVMLQLYGSDNSIADPFMVTVPGIDQFLSEYEFVVPSGFGSNFINLVIKSSYTGIVAFNGVEWSCRSVYRIYMNNTQYSIYGCLVTPGYYRASHKNNVTFGLWVYGTDVSDYACYAFPGGYRIKV